MLKQLFGSEARVRILSLFMLNPASEFYLREIARQLDLSPHAVTQETKRPFSNESTAETMCISASIVTSRSFPNLKRSF